MTWLRHGLAHAAILGTLLGGCALSHGLEGSRLPSPDAGPFDAARPDARPPDSGPRDAMPDGSIPDARPSDAGPDGGTSDGGVVSCDRQDAQEDSCSDVDCDAPDSWYWDGQRCYPVACGTCFGEDCGDGFASPDECEALHAGCEARLCTDTGGEWRWWDEVCGPYLCGFAAPEICLVGGPACDCGPDETFNAVFGCVDGECADVDIQPDILCINTGGLWLNICCDTVCGEDCGADCSNPACECGADEVFHPLRGCERARECMERDVGQSCTAAARCEDGSLCCDSCGGAGCAGAPTCRLPICAPDVDMCGYDPDAP